MFRKQTFFEMAAKLRRVLRHKIFPAQTIQERLERLKIDEKILKVSNNFL